MRLGRELGQRDQVRTLDVAEDAGEFRGSSDVDDLDLSRVLGAAHGIDVPFTFGVWDLVFYASLWVMLDWPGSLSTWDVTEEFPMFALILHDTARPIAIGSRLM